MDAEAHCNGVHNQINSRASITDPDVDCFGQAVPFQELNAHPFFRLFLFPDLELPIMSAVLPTFSPSGWVKTVNEKADYAMAHFFEADYNQSNLYKGNVANLQALIQQNGHDMFKMTQALQSSLEKYLSNYFQLVEIAVTSDEDTNGGSSAINLTIRGTVAEDGKKYSFGRLLMVKDTKIQKILDITNADGSAQTY